MAADTDHFDALDKLADTHQKRLAESLVTLENRIADLVATAPLQDGKLFDLEWAVNARNELRQAINEDYLAEVDSIIRDYDQVAVDAATMLGEYGDIVQLDQDVIGQLQQMTFQGFEDLGAEHLDIISKQVYESTLTGATFANSVNAVREVVGKDMARYASQQVHDSLMQFDRAVNTKIALDSGAEKFKYRGSDDSKTRTFCRKHVNKVYTIDEINEIWQGEWTGKSSSNAFATAGGYNCRHRFRPVFDDVVEDQQVDEPVETVQKRQVPEKLTKKAAIASVTSKLKKSTVKPKDFRERPTDQYGVGFDGKYHTRYKPYKATKYTTPDQAADMLEEQAGKIFDRGMTDQTLTLLDSALDETAELATKFKVPNIRTVVPIGGRATMSMGDGRLGINPTYWNPRAKNAYGGTEATTKKIAKKQAERSALMRDKDALNDKYYEAVSKQDWETAIPLDVQIDEINNKLGKLDTDISKLEDSLPRPASTWKVGDDLDDRPWSAKQYYDTPEEQFDNTVRHEFGHLVHQEHNRTGSEGGMFDAGTPIENYLEDLFWADKSTGRRSPVRVFPTKYSEANHKEWWAENFALYNGGRKDLVDPKLSALMDEMVSKDGRLTVFDGFDFRRGEYAK